MEQAKGGEPALLQNPLKTCGFRRGVTNQIKTLCLISGFPSPKPAEFAGFGEGMEG
jgi:hypothetical protein